MQSTDFKLEVNQNSVRAVYRGLSATMDGNVAYLAHMGCKKLGKLLTDVKPFPQELAQSWDKRFSESWRSNEGVTKGLAEAIGKVLGAIGDGLCGMVLYDTMRKGSDCYRPGRLITDAAELVRNNHPAAEITYARNDNFCPSAELLAEARSDMRFGTFAAAYARELDASGARSTAAMAVIAAQAERKMATFYCIDPYVPDFGNSTLILSDVPYEDREWIETLGDVGCHRVVLAEETIRFLVGYGISVKLFEIDPTFHMHTREFSAQK